ncbi:MAG: VOC family protein [Bacteriovoracaceae bacterium]|jgi:predicted adenylyl cyclase CyaB|nr:VOC family protein [Bacteriovoracaceae bacterium]
MSKIINYEIKSRCSSHHKIESILKEEKAFFSGEDHQVDTYFKVDGGRLKHRRGNVENSLIYYQRSDLAEARESHVQLEKLVTDNSLEVLLAKALGINVVVDKRRKIYFIDNIKFHIDYVKDLGVFVEIEAIDEKGALSLQELQEQCESYIKRFGLKRKDFLSLSYSDLVQESFKKRIYREAEDFLKLTRKSLSNLGVKLNMAKLDHLCFRVTGQQEYEEYKKSFAQIGEKLVESEIGGRLISTYRLETPINCDGELGPSIVELASPKKNNNYALGFEHAEIVIEESFESLYHEFQDINFDKKGADKSYNPDIRIKFEEGHSVKFHHQSLEEVINLEKTRA